MTDDNLARARAWIERAFTDARIVGEFEGRDLHFRETPVWYDNAVSVCAAVLAAAVLAKGEADAAYLANMPNISSHAAADALRACAADVPPPPATP